MIEQPYRWMTQMISGCGLLPHNRNDYVCIGVIKSAITRSANVNDIPFAWRHSFHEHIIRNTDEKKRCLIETRLIASHFYPPEQDREIVCQSHKRDRYTYCLSAHSSVSCLSPPKGNRSCFVRMGSHRSDDKKW